VGFAMSGPLDVRGPALASILMRSFELAALGVACARVGCNLRRTQPGILQRAGYGV
jgi:hypothetical protein